MLPLFKYSNMCPFFANSFASITKVVIYAALMSPKLFRNYYSNFIYSRNCSDEKPVEFLLFLYHINFSIANTCL